jgi:antitoxin component of MazEF toxin-antitoxin module
VGARLKHEAHARLTKQGNSTGLTLPRDTLLAAGLTRGDNVTITADRAAGTITVRKADDAYGRAMEAGRAFAARYRRTLAALAK